MATTSRPCTHSIAYLHAIPPSPHRQPHTHQIHAPTNRHIRLAWTCIYLALKFHVRRPSERHIGKGICENSSILNSADIYNLIHIQTKTCTLYAYFDNRLKKMFNSFYIVRDYRRNKRSYFLFV